MPKEIMKTITLMDGAVGTNLWDIAEEKGIEKVPVWQYNITHPEIVEELHRRFLQCGARQILANTFSANRQMVERYEGFDPAEVVSRGVRIAQKARGTSDATVALAIGPLLQMMEPWGDMTRQEARSCFAEMISAGVQAGADAIVLQTFIDLDMMCVAAEEAKKSNLPVYCMMSFEKVGKTIMGNSVDDFIAAMEAIGVDGVGLNCSLNPDMAEPVMRMFAGKTKLKLLFKPNAGKPIMSDQARSEAACSAQDFVRAVAPALLYADYIGGCCGVKPEYIELLRDEIQSGKDIVMS